MGGTGGWVSVRFDFGEVERMIRAGDRVYTRAAASVINKAMAKIRTRATRGIAERAHVAPQKLIRSRMRLYKAKPYNLRATLGFLIRKIPAIRLAGVKQTGVGVLARGGHSWPHAFIHPGSGGHRMVFQRKGRERMPIDAVKLEISGQAEDVLQEEIEGAAENVREDLERELAWRLQNAR